MLELIGWFALGLFLLLLGADSFIKGASGVALRFGIKPFVVGMVLVGFGTSAPEMAVNMTAAWQGRYELAVGNIVGSNIANIGLILGLIALFKPLAVQMRLLRVEVPLLIGISLLLWLLSIDGWIGRMDGILLLVGFGALMIFIARDAKREPALIQEALAETAETRSELWRNSLRLIVGLTLLVFASQLMVESAVGMATMWGMSELIVGLTVVAIGTSLPELAASGIAAWRGHSDIAVGNVVGSCLFNILLIIGATASLHPLGVSKSLLWVEFPAMIAFALVLYPMVRGDLTIRRHEGGILLAAFVAFMVWQLMMALG